MTSPSGGNEHLCSSSSSSSFVGPCAVKSDLDGVAAKFPKSVDDATGNIHSNRKNARIKEISLSTKRIDSRKAIQANGSNNQAPTSGRRSVERDPELAGSGRKTDPENFRTLSSERSPRGTNQRQIRSASGTRGRAVRLFEGDGAASATERGRSVGRSASRDRTVVGGSHADDVLMISRDGRGLHRVRDSSRNRSETIGYVQKSNVDDKSLTRSAEWRRKSENPKIKAEKDRTDSKSSIPREPVVFRRSLSMSLESKQQDKEDEKLKSMTTPERKRTASFSSTAQKTSSPSIESRAADDRAIESPQLSPTKSEFFLEEYRKLELGIQKLINDATEIVSVDKAEIHERKANGITESKQYAMEYACDTIQLKSPTAELVSSGNLSASKERVSTAVRTDCGSVSGSSTMISGYSSDVADSVELCKSVESVSDSNELQKKKKNLKSPNDQSSSRHLNCLRTEPHPKIPTPVRPVSATGVRSSGGRSLSRSRADGVVEVRKTTPTRTENDCNSNTISSRSRPRTVSARNRDRDQEEASLIGPRFSSAHTPSSSSTEQTMRIQEGRPRSRHSSVGSGRRRDEEEVVTSEYLLNWDEYRRRVLLRKEADTSGQRSSTRIPRPIELRETVVGEPHHKVLEKLKHNDSGIDIHQP